MSESQHIFPRVQVHHRSPNQSSRFGARIGLLVAHATAGHNRPGISDLVGLGNYFDDPSLPPSRHVSSHVATDNEGHSARYVADGAKAWHVAAFNRVSLGVEQILPGTGSEITSALYHETARWLATWSYHHDVPLRPARVSGFQVVRTGVISHQALGPAGGGHTDPGPGYSMSHLIELAKSYKSRQVAWHKVHG